MLSFEHRLMRALREELETGGYCQTLQLMQKVVRAAGADTRTSLDVRDFGAIGDNEAVAMRPKPTEEYSPGWEPGKQTFTHKYEYRRVGVCLNCGPFNHVGPHVCKPKIPEAVCLRCHKPVKDHPLTTYGIVCPDFKTTWVTIQRTELERLEAWWRWAQYTAVPALNVYRNSPTAASALGETPRDPSEKTP